MAWSGSHRDSVGEAKIRALASLSAKLVLFVTQAEREGQEGGGCCSGQRRPLCRHKDLTTEAPAGAGPDRWIEKPLGDWGRCQELPPSLSLVVMGVGRWQAEAGKWVKEEKQTQGQAPYPNPRPRPPEPELPTLPLPSFSWAACQLKGFPPPRPRTPPTTFLSPTLVRVGLIRELTI